MINLRKNSLHSRFELTLNVNDSRIDLIKKYKFNFRITLVVISKLKVKGH